MLLLIHNLFILSINLSEKYLLSKEKTITNIWETITFIGIFVSLIIVIISLLKIKKLIKELDKVGDEESIKNILIRGRKYVIEIIKLQYS